MLLHRWHLQDGDRGLHGEESLTKMRSEQSSTLNIKRHQSPTFITVKGVEEYKAKGCKCRETQPSFPLTPSPRSPSLQGRGADPPEQVRVCLGVFTPGRP